MDNLLLSFLISYIVGNVPLIKEWFSYNKEVESKIDSCLERALKKWTINSSIRNIEMSRKRFHLDELRKFLIGEKIQDHSYVELIELWINEIKQEEVCRNFILEHKQEITNMKLDKGFAIISQRILQIQQSLEYIKDDNLFFHQKEMELLHIILAQKESASVSEIVSSINNVIKQTVCKLILNLHLETAKGILSEIEKSCSEIISQNQNLATEILKLKAHSLTFSNPSESYKLYHKAYLLNEEDITLIEKEIIRLYKNNEDEEALILCEKLSEDNIYNIVIKVCSSNDIEKTYQELPKDLKDNYNLRYNLLALLSERGIDTSFLFNDAKVRVDNDLTFDNLFSWLYVVTWETVRFHGTLLLTSKYLDISDYKEAFEVAKRFYILLEKTEVERYFSMVKAHMCYWGLIVEGHESWIDEILAIHQEDVKGHQTELTMLQVSMLMIAQRYSEAFTLIASIKSHININIANYVIMMTLHADDINYLKWLIPIVKEKGIKLDSTSSKCIASYVNNKTGAEIRELIEDELFLNIKEASVLRQLCLYYEKKEINKDELKNCCDYISDDMVAYAAFLLANSNEAQFAFDILSGKVDKKEISTRLRIFMQVMSQLPDQLPELYELLKEHRKRGWDIDDNWLQMEFSMATRVSDYDNAFDVIKILLFRYPDDEYIYTNYLRMIGRFSPSDLEINQKKVLSFVFKDFRNINQIYQLYAENNYLIFATEFLFIHVRQSDDWTEKTFYNQESTMGLIKEVVNQKYEIAQEDLFAICSKGDGSKVIYHIKQSNEIGKIIEGHKEGEKIIVKIAGEDVTITIEHIINKYGKLSYDIMKETMEGDNPYMKPFKIDMKHPLESIESAIKTIYPNHINYNDLQRSVMEQYEKCELGLTQLISSDKIICDYYERLFSQEKVFVAPYQLLNKILLMRGNAFSSYVLDLPAILLLYEYQNLSGIEYKKEFIIASSIYEFVLSNLKNYKRLVTPEFARALNGTPLVRYDSDLSKDIEKRLKGLIEWMDKYCEKEVPSKALAIDINVEEKSGARNIMMDTLTLMLVSGRCLITEDMLIEKMMRFKINIISTEAYMMRSDIVANDFGCFLADCNYIGIWLSKDYIVREYMKMEKAMPNKMTYIMQNAMYNEVLRMSIMAASLIIAQDANDKQLARITITNMMASMIKSFDNRQKSSIVSKTMYALPDNSQTALFVKQCLQDAAKICNVIILPRIMV